MRDILTDILQTLARHPLRTLLTAFSVGWGVFILVTLLGAGVGFENNLAHEWRDDATNSIFVWRDRTSKPYEGHGVGRRINFNNRDLDALRYQLQGSEYVAGRFNPPTWYALAKHEGETGRYNIRAVNEEHRYIERTNIRDGRYLNTGDLEGRRKVAVIGRAVERDLFKGKPALGEYIQLGDMPFLVIGVFTDAGGEREEEKIYVPLSTGQIVWQGGDRVNALLLTVSEDASEETVDNIEASLRALLAERHHFDPTDRRAIRIRNNLATYMDVREALTLVKRFIWLVGLGTLLAGIVGVANILLVSVRERTPEIGLRKAIGATPIQIVATVLGEALFLTSVAGYLGLLSGVGFVRGIPWMFPDNEYIRDPEVNIGIGLMATALITVLGTLAGAIPAFHAAKIQPVEALRGS